jgi:hypothetical protein
MNKINLKRWWLALILFSGFLITFFMDLTGVAVHQWLGLAIGGLALYHLLSHWSWVEAVGLRFFDRISHKARLYFLLDGALFIGFSIMISTGLIISTWLNLAVPESILVIHITSSIVTLLITLVKLIAHWKWLGATTRNIFGSTNQFAPRFSPAQQEPLNRREFMKVMSVVSLTSLVALTSASRTLNLLESDGTFSQESANSLVTDSNTSSSYTGSSPNTGICQVQCGRRCSYPGHCRRYTDSNANGRCDLGECV